MADEGWLLWRKTSYISIEETANFTSYDFFLKQKEHFLDKGCLIAK